MSVVRRQVACLACGEPILVVTDFSAAAVAYGVRIEITAEHPEPYDAAVENARRTVIEQIRRRP